MVLELTNAPIAQVGMLVRRPVNEVYEAFVDPAITTKFWFTKSTGKLEAGKRVRWKWEMYGAVSMIQVRELEAGKRILLDWGLDARPRPVEWTFTPYGTQATYVNIINSGFMGDGESLVAQAKGSEARFVLVLAGLKAYLEFGILLNLIADRFPDQFVGGHKWTPSAEEGIDR